MKDDDEITRVRVLIVEDNPHMRLLLRHLLQPHFDLELVDRVDDAIEAATRQRFDLLLLDINLGEQQTGIDLLNHLRRMVPYDTTPAVACTAYARQSDRDRFLARGFDDYVAKPFTREQLYTTIETTLSRALHRRLTPTRSAA